MSKVKDYYKLLDLSPEASELEIKQAFVEHGESKSLSNDDAKELKEAFDVLSNPKLRAQYDSYLKKGRPQTKELKRTGKGKNTGALNGNGHAERQMWEYLTLESSKNYGTTKFYVNGEMQPDLKNARFDVVVNTMGSDGWELVGIAASGEEKTFIFKRPTDVKYEPPKQGPAA